MDGSTPAPAEITRLLHEWQSGNRDALDRLMPLVYAELHTLASRQLSHEWRHNRLQTTAVVSEAYVKLFGQREVDWQNRGHFFAIAAQLMRRILVDHARRGLREKHGGQVIHVALEQAASTAGGSPIDADRSARAERRARETRAARRDAGPRGRAAIFRRADGRGNRRRADRVAENGQTRVGARQGLAAPRADRPDAMSAVRLTLFGAETRVHLYS